MLSSATNSDLENKFILEEYKSLRQEIQARLSRISRLQEGLLLGTLIYITTLILPHLPKTESIMGQVLSPLFYLFLFIVPFAAFAVELICISEQDAVFRAGIYIRDNIERKYRTSTFKGWEDWLERLDRVKRRRISDKLTIYVRYGVIILYCFASSFIVGPYLKTMFSFSSNDNWYRLCLFSVYLAFFGILMGILKYKRKEEFSSPFYSPFVVDVDGCLYDKNREISEPNKKALELLTRKGVHVILATGRQGLSLKRICDKLDLKGYHVACHGATIFDATNNQEQEIHWIQKEAVASIIRKIESNDVLWVAFTESGCYCKGKDHDEVKKRLLDRGDLDHSEENFLTSIPNIVRWQWKEPVQKILCYITVDSEQEKEQKLKKSIGDQFQVVRSTNKTVEILDRKASKVETVKEILKQYDQKPGRILVVGDYDNDIELLSWGHHAIAPSNASRKVRELNRIDVLRISGDEDLIQEIVKTYYDL